jgi:hypothetical protein
MSVSFFFVDCGVAEGMEHTTDYKASLRGIIQPSLISIHLKDTCLLSHTRRWKTYIETATSSNRAAQTGIWHLRSETKRPETHDSDLYDDWVLWLMDGYLRLRAWEAGVKINPEGKQIHKSTEKTLPSGRRLRWLNSSYQAVRKSGHPAYFLAPISAVSTVLRYRCSHMLAYPNHGRHAVAWIYPLFHLLQYKIWIRSSHITWVVPA